MSAPPELTPSLIERIRRDLVGLKMPRAWRRWTRSCAAWSMERSAPWKRSTSCSARS